MKALLIGGDPASETLLRETLARHGHTLRSLASPDEALRLLRDEEAFLIIVDAKGVGAGGGNPADVARRIRALPRGPEACVLLLDGEAATRCLEEAGAAGVDLCLLRPLDPALLELHIGAAERRANPKTPAAAEPLRRALRALRTLRACHRVFVTAPDEPALMASLCRVIVEQGGYRLAWIGLAESDPDRTVRPAAQAGFEEGYLEHAHITWSAQDPTGRGPTGRALRTGQPCWARNILTDPDYAPWRANAVRRGYASSLAVPFRVDGRTVGALNLYAAEPDAFDAEELDLLSDLADDLGFAVSHHRLRVESRQLEARLIMADRLASLGILAAGIAHEINNPLASLAVNAEFVLDQLPRARDWSELELAGAQQALQGVREAVEQLKGIVRSVRSFARPDDPGSGTVDLGEVVEGTLHLAAHTLRGRARLRVEKNEVAPVRGNRARLEQVFLNLIVNAAQAIEEGHPARNEVAVTIGRDGPQRVCVAVSDTGCGIPAKERARLFEPFFTTKPPEIGTGLGLFLCRGIVASLGGEITVESEPGRGSTFRVYLPSTDAR